MGGGSDGSCSLLRENRQETPVGEPQRSALAAGVAFRINCGRRRLPLESLTVKLAAACGESEVVSALLAYLEGKFERGLFLALSCDGAREWRVKGVGTGSSDFAGDSFALAAAPQLLQVVQERRPFMGELGEEAAGALIEAMAAGTARQTLLVPLAVAGRVVAVLCAFDLQPRLVASLSELQRVAASAGLAFEMLCIKRRIRSG